MTLKDMSNYRAVHRPVVNTTYHGNRVFSASAPTSGPILLNVLNLIEAYNFTEVSALNYHRFTEALKFGYSARAEIGDPGFIKNQERLDEIITKEWADTVRPYITDVSIFLNIDTISHNLIIIFRTLHTMFHIITLNTKIINLMVQCIYQF
jgi:gamma-glutamyltranspeptidase/glutathione hydrolase/leukotriene-C4 hydrolase